MKQLTGTIKSAKKLTGKIQKSGSMEKTVYVNDYVFINNHTIVQTFSPIEEDGEG